MKLQNKKTNTHIQILPTYINIYRNAQIQIQFQQEKKREREEKRTQINEQEKKDPNKQQKN